MIVIWQRRLKGGDFILTAFELPCITIRFFLNLTSLTGRAGSDVKLPKKPIRAVSTFLKKFLAGTCPFWGATGTPVLDFW